jgi:hypothetical protein
VASGAAVHERTRSPLVALAEHRRRLRGCAAPRSGPAQHAHVDLAVGVAGSRGHRGTIYREGAASPEYGTEHGSDRRVRDPNVSSAAGHLSGGTERVDGHVGRPLQREPTISRRSTGAILPARALIRLRNTLFEPRAASQAPCATCPSASARSHRRERTAGSGPTRTYRLPEREREGNRTPSARRTWASHAIPSVHLNHRPDWTGSSGDPSRRRHAGDEARRAHIR